MGLSVASCVDDEGPSSLIPENLEIDQLLGSVRIHYRAGARPLQFPLQKVSQAFKIVE